MRNILTILAFLFSIQLEAQTTLYGVAKVPGTNKIIYLSSIDPTNGSVTVFSGPLASNHMGLGAGNAYDFTRGFYYYFSPSSVITEANVNTGGSRNIPINLSGCGLESPQYTCKDSSMYGFQYCNSPPGIGFGKFDLVSGTFVSTLINFSTFPGEDYTYDKINHRYLFTSNATLYTIDLNTMNVDTLNLPIPTGNRFRFPQYNCNNSLVYGCYIIQGSLATYLASFDLTSGVFTILSSSPFVYGGILGGGTSLDIINGLYYYNLGSSIISVRISDGTVAANNPYTFSISGPTMVFYIQLDQTCYCEKPISLGVDQNDFSRIYIMNPIKDEIRISGVRSKAYFRLYDITSRLLIEREFQIDLTLNATNLQKGTYLYTLDINGCRKTGKLVKQ